MSASPDRLYELLPAIYRIRDLDRGEPLRALLEVIAEQVDVVEGDIAQLYENWFIETCQDWAVPYIAELIGYRPTPDAGSPGAGTDARDQRRNSTIVPRREVANTIRYRRRKGALALLELLARDVAGWPARAVEFFQLLSVAQHLDRIAPQRGRSADIRNADALDRIDGPFDELAHCVDVRRISARVSRGRYNIPSIGLFVWRLKPYSVSKAPAFCVDRARHQYTFSILGNDAPLFTLPIDEPSPTHIADELNVPERIRRRAFAERTADYYGPGKSLCIYRDSTDHPVPLDQIVPADLSDWAYRPQGEQVAVDPVLGRIAFAPRSLPRTGVWVTYHYGFSDNIGGGEYGRRLRPRAATVYRVGAGHSSRSINEALEKWRDDAPDEATIEIADSGAYVEQIEIVLAANQSLELRAASGARPVIRLLDFYTNRPDAMRIEGPSGDDGATAKRLTLDGLVITGRSVQATGRIGKLVIRHCTFVPGWSLDEHCEPQHEIEPSLELINTSAQVTIERSIIGSIQVSQGEVETDPLVISISDSIVDACRRNYEAIGAPGYLVAHVALHIERTTVIGRVQVHAIDLAENCIFDGLATVARRQRGCMRFCYVTPGSRTPRRYACQPDLALRGLEEQPTFAGLAEGERDDARRREALRVRPQFNSERYGTPTYCQLSETGSEEIWRGADDEAEMGVFHDLFQPQREANLRARIAEYTPASSDAGIVFVS